MKDVFNHIVIQGDPSLPVLLLLHGTGGDERDLVELGQAVSPGSTILSVRGKVIENGMPRFFRRLAEGVFDLEDLAFRTDELADFIADFRMAYGFEDAEMIALGYSNGANIAASLLLSRPETLQGAILLRAMVPFTPKVLRDLSGKRILMLSGLMDPIATREQAEKLSVLFQESGAQVNLKIKPAGHALIPSDLSDMQQWITS